MKSFKGIILWKESPTALVALGVPIMIGMLINALYNLADAYLVGGLGESPMGAISIVFPLGQVWQVRRYTAALRLVQLSLFRLMFFDLRKDLCGFLYLQCV